MSEHTAESDARREADLLIEVGHPSRPDREELMRQHIERIKARARAEALMDAREAWVGGEGTRVLFNKDRLDLTLQGRVAYWLRTRADSILASVTPPGEGRA